MGSTGIPLELSWTMQGSWTSTVMSGARGSGAFTLKNEIMLATHKFDTRERGWHSYTEKQIASAVAAAQAIATHYGLIDVLGHDDIAPNRKRDPGPAFPMESFEAIVLGRNTDSLPSQITTTVLNIREGPGTNFTKLDAHSPLKKGTRLQPIRREGSWYFVEVIGDDGLPECTGWVHGDYIVADTEDA